MSEFDRNAVQAIADALWAAERDGVPCAPVRDAIAALGGDALDAAYAVQRV
ncbi:2-keto-4-pentenoate hydratase, partial [Burkholderia sp. Se-20378]|nr:2-keto-4-pentenoate hydratase [Burkholderia sp. Se-20378]